MDAQNIQKTKGMMHSFAMGEAMIAAANDYKRELKQQEEEAQRAARRGVTLDMQDLQDDEDLQKLYEDRIAKIKEEQEKRQLMQQKGHGSLNEIHEKDFLEAVTKTKRVVAHFFHREFERCKIMDAHLAKLAKGYFDTLFVKISAPDAPFFVEKLQVQVLPCVVLLKDGITVERVVGFDGLGKDDFPTSVLEARLLEAGVLVPQAATEDPEPEQNTNIRKGNTFDAADVEDESSDFED
ncbi:unnamed protein product [Pedinophyceae sp. YPF-701]|nr:unnamed protein product [Pedinophyceae sp. YPF-701]